MRQPQRRHSRKDVEEDRTSETHWMNLLLIIGYRIDNVPTAGALFPASRFTSTCAVADDHMPFFERRSTERARSAHNIPMFGCHILLMFDSRGMRGSV